MYKKLIMFCLLVLILLSLTSCTRLSYVDKYDCTRYCIENRCMRTIDFKSVDAFGSPVSGKMTLMDQRCGINCSRSCEYCNSPMVKEWKENKKLK